MARVEVTTSFMNFPVVGRIHQVVLQIRCSLIRVAFLLLLEKRLHTHSLPVVVAAGQVVYPVPKTLKSGNNCTIPLLIYPLNNSNPTKKVPTIILNHHGGSKV